MSAHHQEVRRKLRSAAEDLFHRVPFFQANLRGYPCGTGFVHEPPQLIESLFIRRITPAQAATREAASTTAADES